MEEIIPEWPPKNDHYVPRQILKRFRGTDRRLAVLDKDSRQIHSRKSVPGSIASEFGGDRYKKNGEERETSYNEIEDNFGKVLNNYLANGNMPNTSDAFLHIRKFIASQIVRSPRYRFRFKERTTEDKIYLDNANVTESFRQSLRCEHDIIFAMNNEGWARSEVAAAQYARICTAIYNSRITIAKAHPNYRFHIGDSPVTPFMGDPIFMAKPRLGGIWNNPDVVLSLPISSEFTLLVMGQNFLRAIQLVDTSRMFVLDGVPSTEVVNSFWTGQSFQLSEQGTMALNELQDVMALNKVYAAEKSDFNPPPDIIKNWTSEWRQRLDEPRPREEILADLEALGAWHTRRRMRHARILNLTMPYYNLSRRS